MTTEKAPASGSLADLQARAEALIAAQVGQLSFWPEQFRGIPNETARSALFTVRRGQRRHIADESILVVGDGEICYRGEELRTDDEDVWLCLLHMVRGQGLDAPATFRPYALLKELGWPTNGIYYRRLKTIIRRLQATSVSIRSKRLASTIGLPLVARFEFHREHGRDEAWKVWIAREMRRLFAANHYTRLDWHQRRELTPVAKRLMDYLCSHAEPYPIKTATLREMCASTMRSPRHWREVLRGALGELQDRGIIVSWRIDDADLVRVVRPKAKPSDAAPPTGR